jgi:hypothetical protein
MRDFEDVRTAPPSRLMLQANAVRKGAGVESFFVKEMTTSTFLTTAPIMSILTTRLRRLSN